MKRVFRYQILLILVLGFSATGCDKDDVDVFSKTPEIRMVETSPTEIIQFQDSVIVTIEYEDGDGDLGFEHPDSLSLRVQDSRLTNPDWYFVAPLAPVGEEVPITGTLKFRLNGTFLLGNGGAEKAVYHISIRDRKNNWSNEISTPEITINP